MIPYAPRAHFTQPNRISDLILRAADSRADSQLRSGQIWGNAVGNLGRIASGYVEDRAAQKQEQAQQAEFSRRDQAALAVMSNPDADPMEFVRIYGPRDGIKVAEGFQAFKKIGAGASQSPEDLFKLYGGLNTVSEKVRAAAYPTVVGNISKSIPALAGALPAEYSPEGWAEIGSLLGGMNPSASPKLEKIEVRQPDGSTSIEFVEPKAGMKFTNAPEPPKPDSRSLELQASEALAKGDTATYQRLLRVQREMSGAGRAPKEVPPPQPQDIGEDSVFINQPAYKKLTNAGKTAVTSMNNFIQDAEKYRQKLDELTDKSGINLTGEDAAELDSMHAALLFSAAKAFEQGALQAPDKAVVEQMIPNPAKWGSILKTLTRGGKAGQLRSMDTALSNFRSRMKSTWGLSPTGTVQPSNEPLERGTRVSAPTSKARNPFR